HRRGGEGKGLGPKVGANQGFGCTGGGQGDGTPISFSFGPACPVMLRLRSAFAVAAKLAPSARGAAVRFARRCTGGKLWRALLWPRPPPFPFLQPKSAPPLFSSTSPRFPSPNPTPKSFLPTP